MLGLLRLPRGRSTLDLPCEKQQRLGRPEQGSVGFGSARGLSAERT